jgi:hypothetical protein
MTLWHSRDSHLPFCFAISSRFNVFQTPQKKERKIKIQTDEEKIEKIENVLIVYMRDPFQSLFDVDWRFINHSTND